MEFVLFVILLFVCALSLVEDRLQRYNRTVYIVITVVLIFFAGLREVGFDRDSGNYEYSFLHYDDPVLEYTIEHSFRLLSHFFRYLTDDVHSIFLFYAVIGVSLKMFAFRKLMPQLWFLPVAVYLGYYYILHDLTQMRSSIVSGLTLCAIPLIYQGRRTAAFWLLAVGCVFHYSAVALLPVLFLGSNNMEERERWFWVSVIPLGYLAYFLHFNIATQFYIPYVTDKIEVYEDLRDRGIAGDEINVFNLVFLIKCMAFLYVLYFYDTVKRENKYIPIMVRLMGISIFTFLFFAQLPVLSFRIGELYGIVEIFIFTYVCFAIRPKWVGRFVTCIIAISLFVIYVFEQKILE